MSEETITAIATAAGRSGIGIVRLSGPNAYNIALKITKKKRLNVRFCHYASYFYEENLIDTGLVIYFKAPHSFTGEDVIEFQAHGSPIALDQLVQATLSLGARIARPGEFSERAFLNNKMDLTQAEAVADLIHAQSLTAARLAVQSIQGIFSEKIHAINEKVIYARMYVEAALDFPEEEIDFLSNVKIQNLLQEIQHELQHLRANAYQGSLIREGLTVVITGKPNAGKSTLINYLAQKEVAIVTDIPGTTRDIMREAVQLDGLVIHLIDTAGLRESQDKVEQEGIKRAWLAVSYADCVIHLSTIDDTSEEKSVLNEQIKCVLPENTPVIQVVNKIDKIKYSIDAQEEIIYLSAKEGTGISLLKDKIKKIAGYVPTEGQFLARRRHVHALDRALEALNCAREQLAYHRAGELLAEDLREIHEVLGEITGEFSTDDLLGKIFSSFCIGK